MIREQNCKINKNARSRKYISKIRYLIRRVNETEYLEALGLELARDIILQKVSFMKINIILRKMFLTPQLHQIKKNS